MVIKGISFLFTVFVIMIFGLAISCKSVEKVGTVEKAAEPKAETVKMIVEDTTEPPEEVAAGEKAEAAEVVATIEIAEAVVAEEIAEVAEEVAAEEMAEAVVAEEIAEAAEEVTEEAAETAEEVTEEVIYSADIITEETAEKDAEE